MSSCLRNCFNIIPGSKIVICFGIIGFKLRIPLCVVLLYLVFQMLVPFVLFNNDDKVGQAVTRDEWPTLDLYIIVINSMALSKGVETGLICFSLQNAC